MNNYNKIYKYIMSFCFILFIGLMIFLHAVTPDRDFSPSENRMLEQKPEVSLSHIIDGSYIKSFEKYTCDQFPLRDFWIGVKSDTERTIGKRENNNILLGKEGYLFQKFTAPSIEELEDKVTTINKFAALNPKVNKYFMLVPTAAKILEDKLPPYVSVSDESKYINYIDNNIDKNINFVDVTDVLKAKKDKYIFYKTDHHWTTQGAYYAYTVLASSMGFTPEAKNSYEIKTLTNDFYGSLYSEGGFRRLEPDSIQSYTLRSSSKYKVWYSDTDETSDSIYDMENLKKKDKYTVFLNSNHPMLKISINNNTNKKLLIIKDSYANSFVPFLMNHYSEIYMVDPRYYIDNINKLITTNNIDDVLILYNVNTFFTDASVDNIANE